MKDKKPVMNEMGAEMQMITKKEMDWMLRGLQKRYGNILNEGEFVHFLNLSQLEISNNTHKSDGSDLAYPIKVWVHSKCLCLNEIEKLKAERRGGKTWTGSLDYKTGEDQTDTLAELVEDRFATQATKSKAMVNDVRTKFAKYEPILDSLSQGNTIKETGEILNCSVAAIYNKLKLVRRYLEDKDKNGELQIDSLGRRYNNRGVQNNNKKCNYCEEWFDLSKFYYDVQGKHFAAKCKRCVNLRAKQKRLKAYNRNV